MILAQRVSGSTTLAELERQVNIAFRNLNAQMGVTGAATGISAAAFAALSDQVTNLTNISGSDTANGGTGNPAPTPASQTVTVATDGVTVGGDGDNSPIFSYIRSSFLVETVPFASSPYAASLEEQQITLFLCSSGSGADFVFDLPVATGSGNVAIIKKIDANAHNIAITPNGTDTIDGTNAAVDISVQYDVLRIVDSAAGAWSIW